ncbi:hypothetical protein ACGFYV_21765 [Streptomyces sp. NPDC048297]|uniref:hypothetical protein n=1 Tax=Streptomyces sp. NPDC048297 TaxID=3365531 RepID=UPI0037216B51
MDSDPGGVMKRLAALLLALVAALSVSVSAPQPAAADDGDGWIGGGVRIACTASGVGLFDTIAGAVQGKTDAGICKKVGKEVSEKVHKAWKDVQESLLGDVILSATDSEKWVIKKVLTLSLLGPSLDLRKTGLFGRDATLAGMLTWLGLVIASFGAMWQIGKMAITGQSRHVGRAMLGWVESTFMSAVGVGLVAVMLSAGDALTSSLVNATFDGKAYDRIVTVMVPEGVSNPITMLCIVAILLLVGIIQLILVFLRQSAIPIQCLLLPVAGGGRAGGETTRQWAPKLITSICVVIAYKPILAVIICTGFAEFGESQTLAEWLRGCATLILAVIAPGPLTRLFAPFGEAVGAGLAAGGVGGALGMAGNYLGNSISGGAGASAGSGGGGGSGDGKGGHGGDGGDGAPADPVSHAQRVQQSMGSQNPSEPGGEGGKGGDAQAAPSVPSQSAGQDAAASTGASAGQGAAAAATGGATVAIQVLDGVNNTAHNGGQNGSNT